MREGRSLMAGNHRRMSLQHGERIAGDQAGWLRGITWMAILAPLPYSLTRVLWAAGIPFDISREGLDNLLAPWWGSLYLLLLVLLIEGTGLFVHIFILHRRRSVPRWIPVLGGRRVQPRWVVAPLLIPIVILAVANIQSLVMLLIGRMPPDSSDGVAPRNIVLMAVVFWIWGVSLTIATYDYYRRTRGWPSA